MFLSNTLISFSICTCEIENNLKNSAGHSYFEYKQISLESHHLDLHHCFITVYFFRPQLINYLNFVSTRTSLIFL